MTTKKRKPRMSVAVAAKYHRRLQGNLTALARKVMREKRSFDWLLAAYRDGVCSGPDWDRSPAWVKTSAQGWMTCFMHFVLGEMLTEWCVWENGRGHVLSRAQGGEHDPDYSKVDGNKGARRWKGTDKVWHGFDPTGEAEQKPDPETLKRFQREVW